MLTDWSPIIELKSVALALPELGQHTLCRRHLFHPRTSCSDPSRQLGEPPVQRGCAYSDAQAATGPAQSAEPTRVSGDHRVDSYAGAPGEARTR